MSEISDQAKRKACELANAEGEGELYTHQYKDPFARYGPEYGYGAKNQALMALARVLQEHSDVAKEWDALLARIGDADLEPGYSLAEFNDRILARRFRSKLSRFILPAEPADPLKDAVAEAVREVQAGGKLHEGIRTALDAAGYEIRRKDRG